MKIAEIKSQIAELKDASRLHERVINEIVEDSKGYDGDFTERLTARLDDIWDEEEPYQYYEDTCAFFRRYQDEIGELLAETIRDTRLQPAELFGDNWDEDDPLCREQQNQTLLAWFAYQAIASQLRNLIEA